MMCLLEYLYSVYLVGAHTRMAIRSIGELPQSIVRKLIKGSAEQVHICHSGEGRNPVKSSIWTPAFAGVTTYSGLPL
jgi:hypothetical protein